MASDYDRIKSGLINIIRRTLGAFIVQRVDFLAAYQCKVVTQNPDGTLELQPDDSRLPPYSKVPIRYGVPGVSALVANGARVLLEFAGGDPQKPIATVWESASVTLLIITATTIKIGGSGASHNFIYGEDFGAEGGAFQGFMQSLATAVGTSGSPAGATAAAATIIAALAAYQGEVNSILLSPTTLTT